MDPMTETSSDQAGEVLDTENAAAVADTPVGDQIDTSAQDDNPDPDQVALLDDDHEEIERGGVKYKVPKALVPELLMQSDYTKKTQEVAETRKALEARETEIAQQSERAKANLQEHAEVFSLEKQVEAYTKVDWASLRAQDADAYREHWDTYQQLKDNLGNAKEALSKKDQERAFEEQRIRAKQLEEATTVLQREIPGWSPDLAGKLTSFGEEKLGLTRGELSQITDPRLIKTLHLAYVGAEIQAKQAKAAKLAEAQKVTPAASISGGKAAGRFQTAADTNDFAAFEKLADDKLKKA